MQKDQLFMSLALRENLRNFWEKYKELNCGIWFIGVATC